MIPFTGSTRAGKRIPELAAQGVKRVALELGGKSASLILDDGDLPTAVKSTVNGCYLSSGQTCTALTRMLVPASKYEEAAKLAAEVAKGFTVGDPLAETTKLGPLSSQAQLERVRNYIRKGVQEGAELVAGGAEPPEAAPAGGYYVRPTVFGKVRNDMTIAQEEIFGPVLAIIPYKDEDEAVRIANDTVYGLAGAVWSKDEARAQRVARRILAGQIDIKGGAFNMNAPFGGYKQSGHGCEAVQLVLGLAVPPLLIAHVVGTRLAWLLLGHHIGYERVVGVLWSDPWAAARQAAMLLIVWTHLCFGIHYWLRIQRWYAGVQPVLFAIALVIPSVALAGFAAAGNEIWPRIEGAGGTLVFYPEVGQTSAEDRARLLAWRQGLELAFFALLAATLLARWLRTVLGGTYHVRHPSGRVISAPIGRSILE